MKKFRLFLLFFILIICSLFFCNLTLGWQRPSVIIFNSSSNEVTNINLIYSDGRITTNTFIDKLNPNEKVKIKSKRLDIHTFLLIFFMENKQYKYDLRYYDGWSYSTIILRIDENKNVWVSYDYDSKGSRVNESGP